MDLKLINQILVNGETPKLEGHCLRLHRAIAEKRKSRDEERKYKSRQINFERQRFIKYCLWSALPAEQLKRFGKWQFWFKKQREFEPKELH